MKETNEIIINNKISYIEATENPLSADIGIIREAGGIWLYDVGNGEYSARSIPGEKCNVVLSHFHQDHVGNIAHIQAQDLYVSKETYGHIRQGIVVKQDLYIGDLHIFPLPSSHCAGSLGLEIDKQYAFVGDAIYCKTKNGECIYNAQLLKEEIEVLRGLDAPYLLVSHFKGLVREKEEVLAELEAIYRMREKSNPFIKVGLSV